MSILNSASNNENKSGKMSKPVVFVIGASGNIGTATLNALSSKYGDKVDIRAGVRNPDSGKCNTLKGLRGVTIVDAEMGGDKAKLTKTLSGVESLFIVTPGTKERAEIAIATAEAAKEAGVKFLLVVSVLTADLTDTVFGAQFKMMETEISKMGVSHCFLRLPLFVDNYWGFKDTIKSESTIYNPVNPQKPYTPVVVADAGNAAAAILSEPKHHGNMTYKIVSGRYTFEDVAAAFGSALGKEVKYKRTAYEDAKKSMVDAGYPYWQVTGILELYHLVDLGSPVTNENDLSQYEHITGEKPTDLKKWVDGVASSFK